MQARRSQNQCRHQARRGVLVLIHDFKLPDIGEGLSEAELLAWLVEVGDSISEGDDVATISTDKVNVDLPSPRSGV
ncbi:MAG: hypothetical protein KAJ57_03560, partial [Woeseiaceae bacterium]|nr:hypothetical protein [Woeseiaceae bacterium]